MFAAHDSGNGLDAVVIGDHDIVRIRRIFLAVEAKNRLAFPGTAYDKLPLTLSASKTCSGRPRSNVT